MTRTFASSLRWLMRHHLLLMHHRRCTILLTKPR